MEQSREVCAPMPLVEKKMRAAVYNRYGKPEDVLHTTEVEEPGNPGPGDVLIRVRLRPVHHGDLLGIAGRYQSGTSPSQLPASGVRVGFEGYGVVEKVGEGVALKPGARVAFFPGRGSWSEKTIVSADFVTEIPDNVSDDAAAQLHVNPLTTALLMRAVENAGAKAGRDVVVLTAAGSAVARLTISVLLDGGYDVIGVVRREAGVNELNVVFPDLPVISTGQEDWEAKVLSAAAGQSIGIVLDPVGGQIANSLVALLNQGGSLISYGNLSGEPISVPALYFSTRDVSLSGVTLAAERPELFLVESTYDLSDVAKAAAHVGKPGKVGTVMLASK
jgi:NADPH:quinone reductase-like Zn-dependent oxidoreductase